MEINGPALRALRQARNLSITRAASEAGVKQPTWSNWERGERNATPENVQRICEVLRVEDPRAVLMPASAAMVGNAA